MKTRMKRSVAFAVALAASSIVSLAARADAPASQAASITTAHAAPTTSDFRDKAPVAGALAAPVTAAIPTIQEARLSNGIRVLVVERHALPIVAIEVASGFGAAQVPPGIAGFASAAATRSTDRIGSTELVTGFSSIGAELDHGITLDSVSISAKCLTPRVDRVAELLSAIAFTASFDGDDVDKVRALRLRDRREATRRSVPLAVAQTLFPATHPYHDRLWGSEDTITRATAKELRAYWHEAFVPARMTIAVTGDVHLNTLAPILERHFGNIENDRSHVTAPLAVVPTPTLAARQNIVLIDKPRETQGKIAVATIGPAVSTDDEYAMRFANELLSHRLGWDLRETHGVTYGISASLSAFRSFGEFSIDSAVETEHVGESLAKILAEVDRLSTEDIDDDGMTRTKNHRVYRTPALFADLEGQASSLAYISVVGLPLDTWKNLPLRIDAVTGSQVRAVAQRYLRTDTMTIVIAGDAAAIVPQLESRKLGPVRIVR